MSYADKVFVKNVKRILTEGTSTKGFEVRPRWEDGTPAHTIKVFSQVDQYDLRKEFPAFTLRQTYVKSAFDETLWIYQKKSNNIADLNSHVWDEWADDTGSIGKAYGYQAGLKHHFPEGYVDQVDHVIYQLKHNPFDRRIMIMLYVPEDLHEMHLAPCAYSITFNVTQDKDGKLILNALLNQRSQDMITASNWNVCQYALFLMAIAQEVGMTPGILTHVVVDAHIYDRHIEIAKTLIERVQYPAPHVWLTPGKGFYELTRDDVHIENYQYGEQIKHIPIAV